ncbi:hypothetical protein E2C01_067665 [Portunus trituberculatus]|uniref:Uncharacterized protein n=1 Tax=Portunus trituberculatus TaxID=210409 RepID=A0A5B7HKE5_PORTR|nr:hypothetical protein [Portunus trituberculatus]
MTGSACFSDMVISTKSSTPLASGPAKMAPVSTLPPLGLGLGLHSASCLGVISCSSPYLYMKRRKMLYCNE